MRLGDFFVMMAWFTLLMANIRYIFVENGDFNYLHTGVFVILSVLTGIYVEMKKN